MYGAKGDGKTDDTFAIQAALDDNSVVYFPDGAYMIDAVNMGIKPNNNQQMILAPGAVLRAIPNGEQKSAVVYIHGVNNVSISGGAIQGEKSNHTGSDGEWGHGVSIKASTRVTVNNVEIFDCWGDCICTGYDELYDDGGNAYDGNQCENISILNCKLHDARRQGISVCSGIDLVIRDCEIYNIAGSTSLSKITLAKRILRELGKDESCIKFVADRKGHDRKYSLDTNKIKSTLYWSANISFDKGLYDTIKWIKEVF